MGGQLLLSGETANAAAADLAARVETADRKDVLGAVQAWQARGAIGQEPQWVEVDRANAGFSYDETCRPLVEG